jgi:hypothetical protein
MVDFMSNTSLTYEHERMGTPKAVAVKARQKPFPHGRGAQAQNARAKRRAKPSIEYITPIRSTNGSLTPLSPNAGSTRAVQLGERA